MDTTEDTAPTDLDSDISMPTTGFLAKEPRMLSPMQVLMQNLDMDLDTRSTVDMVACTVVTDISKERGQQRLKPSLASSQDLAMVDMEVTEAMEAMEGMDTGGSLARGLLKLKPALKLNPDFL